MVGITHKIDLYEASIYFKYIFVFISQIILIIFSDEWDDELRLKRNQLDVLQAHNRFIQTKEEINRRNSGFSLDPAKETIICPATDGNSSTIGEKDVNGNVKEVDNPNDAIIIDCREPSHLKSV